jgi:hypothetical protein
MDETERQELISRLFALLTAKLEDAAGVAAEGQGRGIDSPALMALATSVREAAQEVHTLADALAVIASQPSSASA